MRKDERRKKLEEKLKNLEIMRLEREKQEREFQLIRDKTRERGLRSSNDAKAWRCRCGRVNQPTKHRFFDVPKFYCGTCNKKFNGKFKFCLGEIEVDGGSLIGEILNQKREYKCIAYSYSKAEEISQRVSNVNHGKDPNEVQRVEPDRLDEEFKKKWEVFTEGESSSMDYGIMKLLLMGLIFREEGILKDSGAMRKLEDLSTIQRDDFEEITRCLASGIPLVATYHTGIRRSQLRYCQIYKSPSRYQKSKSPSGPQGSESSTSPSESQDSGKRSKYYGHAVVIIGALMEYGAAYLYFVSSWSKLFCARRNKRGEVVRGGIGKIRLSDLTKNMVKVSQPHMTDPERRLETESSSEISKRNYLLMMATKKQLSDKMALDARRGKLDRDFEKSYNDHMINGAFCDDEAGYSQYAEDKHHYNEKAVLGNQRPNQPRNSAPSIGSDSITGTPLLNSNQCLNCLSRNAGVAQEATFVGIAGNTRTNGAAAIGGLGSADLKSVLSGSGAGLRGYHSTGSPNMVGSSDSSILSQTVQAPAMLQSIMPDPHSVNKFLDINREACNLNESNAQLEEMFRSPGLLSKFTSPNTSQLFPFQRSILPQFVLNRTCQDGNNGVSATGNVGLGAFMSRLNVLCAGGDMGLYYGGLQCAPT